MAKRKEHRILERNDDLGYPIFIAQNTRDELLAFLRTSGPPSVILCDANRHVRAIADGIARATGDTPVSQFALGESRKRLSTVERVLDAMAAAGVERGPAMRCQAGEAVGFACAIYMRGIRYAHVATSLVAMVDAAIGGKTGVDLRRGKNLAGCFRDPIAVFCSTDTLETLSAGALREGLAEIVKAAIIEGGDLFDLLEELAPHPVARWPWLEVIPAAVKVKTMAVADDRLETGARATLNLGHTFAHAIERAANYSIAHGKAVALGLRAAGLLALRTGRFSRDEHLRVLTLLALFGLPMQTSLAPNAILAAMRSDKKKRGGRLRFVVPRAIGDVEYGVECADRTVRAVLERMQQPPENVRARR